MARLSEKHATLILDGSSYPLVDWNPLGFQITGWQGKLKKGARIRVRMIIPHRGKSAGFSLDAWVVRLDPQNHALAGVFTDVEQDDMDRMMAIFDSRLH